MIFSFACQLVAFGLLLVLWLVTSAKVAYCLLCFSFFVSFFYVSYLLGNFLDQLPRSRVSSKNKAVFITGCDSGFGYLLALRLDSLGYKVFAGCLSTSGKGAVQLKSTCSSKLNVLQVDVTKDESVQKAYDIVVKNLDDDILSAVVNNAGIFLRGEAEWMPLEDYQRQLEVNAFGVVRVTKKFLPLLRHYKGRVVTTASYGGRCTMTGFVPYCMSKHAAASFCDGLRMEMKKFGVMVISVEPFSYRTGMSDPQTIADSTYEMWSKASDTIKAEYGSDYIATFKNSGKKFLKTSTNHKVHHVIDTLVEAVTVTNPHYTYTVGGLKAVLGSWLIQRLPRWAKEYAIRRFVTFDTDLEVHLRKKLRSKTNGKKDS